MDNPLPPVRGTLGPERAQRAEVPGQVEVNILELRLEYRPDLEGINSWWRLEFDDKAWDVVGPPTIRKFTVRQTRHIALHVRERGVGIG